MLPKYILIFFLNFNLCINAENLWHSYLYRSEYQNREELLIRNVSIITEHFSEDSVSLWRSIEASGKWYIFGMSENGVISVSIDLNSAKNKLISNTTNYEFSTTPSNLTVFKYWDTNLRKQQIVVVLLLNSDLKWYKLEKDLKLTHFWTWPLEKVTHHIEIFQINYGYQILIINTYEKETTGDLYEFHLNPKNFWLRQTIALEMPAFSLALSELGPHYFLSIPQENVLQIYKLSDQCDKFSPYINLTSTHIKNVVSFNIGYKPFLAIGGLNTSIYQVTPNELIKQEIKNFNPESINFWLPVPIFRAEVFLLTQRSLVHGLHKSLNVGIIDYNGNDFEKHEDVPCDYFGESTTTLSCLTDQDVGLIGATSVSLGERLFLIVPRKNRPSEMYKIDYEMRVLPNPVEEEVGELIKMQKSLQQLLDEQNRQIETWDQKEVSLVKSRKGEVVSESNMKTWSIDEMEEQLKVAEDNMENLKNMLGEAQQLDQKHFERVFINGLLKVDGEAVLNQVLTDKINDQPADFLLDDIVNKNNLKGITGKKTFKNVEFKSLKITEPLQNVTVNENLTLKQPIHVDNLREGTVNGVNLEDQVVPINKPYNGSIRFNTVAISQSFQVNDKFFIPDNITVQYINGQNLTELLHQICLYNAKCYIPEPIEILGQVTVNKVFTNFLNKLKYPEEYIFRNKNSDTEITGFKTFENSLSSSGINTIDGLIDGIDTKHIITLNTDQEIPHLTFENLEVLESLQVNGEVMGDMLDKFLPNPTLEETDFIKARVHLQNLEIDGSIILNSKFNDKNFESLLSCKVYKDEDEALIEAMKEFPEGFTVHSNMEILSNSINNISLNNLVTKHTEQEMAFNELNGDVAFENLYTTGLYDSINIKNLDQNTVKLTGQQYISSDLIFEDVEIENLDIIKEINNRPIDEFMASGSSVLFEEDLELENLQVKTVVVEGNFTGQIQNFNIAEFNERRLSRTEEQFIPASYIVDELIIQDLDAENINDFSYQEYFNYTKVVERVQSILNEENFTIEDLLIKGSVKIANINGERALNLGGSLFKKGFNNFNISNVIFKNNVYLDNIEVDNYAGLKFNEIVDNLIYKDDKDVKITGNKVFLKGFTAKKLIETNKLNNIPIDDILRLQEDADILAPLQINGPVVFEDDIHVLNGINGNDLELFHKEVELKEDQCHIKGDVVFKKPTHIENLDIKGGVNGKPVEILNHIVNKNSDFKLFGETIFENEVNIKGNLTVSNKVNNIELATFASEVVTITNDAIIEGPVVFINPVTIEKQLEIDSNLESKFINGFNVSSWPERAIFIDRGLLKGNYSFEDVACNEFVQVEHLNNISINDFIPLRTNQEINELLFDEVILFNDSTVGGLVNDYNLRDEFENTAMINKEQEVLSNVIFSRTVVVNNSTTVNTINGFSFDKIVTTNTDQNLSAVYNFGSKVNIDGDIILNGRFNNINLTLWNIEGLLTSADYSQDILDSWNLTDSLIFENDVTGTGLINGMEMKHLKKIVDEKRNFEYKMERQLIRNYNNFCKDMLYFHEKTRKQIYKFDYFEDLQTLTFVNDLRFTYNFNDNGKVYILMQQKDACIAHVTTFNGQYFVPVIDVPIGQISQAITTKTVNASFLIVINEPNCDLKGTNIWQSENGNLSHIMNLKSQELLQESLIPGTFYGISKHTITEFRLTNDLETHLIRIRRWTVEEEGLTFVPRGFATGLSVTNGRKLYRLQRDDPIVEDFSYDYESITTGTFTEEPNTYFPGRADNDFTTIQIGSKYKTKTFLATATQEKTSIDGSLDFIKIFEDPITGKLFQKIGTYKPSSLLNVAFDNGQSLLVFLENNKVLQIYEYKGIEGFKHRLSANVEGYRLFVMSLNKYPNENGKKMVGVINKNEIRIMEALMLGNKFNDEFKCSL